MKLVYVSPVRYASFAQRPHHFVEYFNRHAGSRTLWIEPHPGRFPRLADLRRPRAAGYSRPRASVETWSPPVAGVDPVMVVPVVRGWLWRRTVAAARAFVDGGDWVLGIGRPSLLALELLKKARPPLSCYDAMDDFPEFYGGWSRLVSRRVEREIACRTDAILVSSTGLESKFVRWGLDVELLRNGANCTRLGTASGAGADAPVFGYVGTIGGWFDWALMARMARALGDVQFDLVGPVMSPPSVTLPHNVRLVGECASEEVPEWLGRFSAGLIPFRINRLTAAIDPIKYYEYRGAGLPVVSTRFGDMQRRGSQPGVYLVDDGTNFARMRDEMETRARSTRESVERFRRENSWCSRFERSRFLRRAIGLAKARNGSAE